ncbi:MAG: FTR1 family iron permease [Desulfocucumaceae bacterium]
MSGAFLITLREGLEAALIIGIILGYLGKTGQQVYNRQVLSGILGAVAASILTAVVFESILGGFEGYEKIFEGTFMLLAVCLLTPMIIWMQRNSKSIKSNLEKQINTAISGQQMLGLALISFLSVYREGVETVLFIEAAALNSSAGNTLIGGILGTATAIGLAVLIFKGTASLNLAAFFKVTGIVLVFFAAGLTAHGVHELQEAGIIPVVIEHVWNTNGIIDENGVLGLMLKSLFGYNGNPSLIEVISWSLYMAIVGRLYIFSNNKSKKLYLRKS